MMRVSLFTINFKKMMAVGVAAMTLCLAGCGQADQVKTISKEGQTASEAGGATTEKGASNGETKTSSQSSASGEKKAAADGYFFDADGLTITTDIEMAPVLEVLGEPGKYFEAASCAFEGLDKYYTYEHFEIDTYPDGDKDYISAIVLIDDLVSTPEGITLGSTRDDVTAAYGENYTMNGSSFIYTKGTTHLTFVFQGNEVKNISYDTVKLDDQ